MSFPEKALHKVVAAFLPLSLPDNCFFTTIGHGGGGRVRGAELKSMGLVAGVPDILIVCAGRAIFIELKSDKGRLSPEQKVIHERITLCGGVVTVCRSLDAVIEFLTICGIPLRARAAA